MDSLWNLINGKKLYLTGIGMVVYAVLGLVLSLHDPQRTVDLVFAGLAMIGIKSAISKLE